MAKILSIETSTNVCSVAIHDSGKLVTTISFHLPQSHSSLLPGVIKDLLNYCSIKAQDLSAVAVSGGPGSYTGLRIGVSTAKGIAFAAGIPIIGLNSLEIMCELPAKLIDTDTWLCPMIDARRMEVYCLLKDLNGTLIWETKPLIVENHSFDHFSSTQICFFGNGSTKCKEILNAETHLFFEDITPEAQYMGRLAFEYFEMRKFEDLAYYEPNYLKEYRTNKPAVKFK